MQGIKKEAGFMGLAQAIIKEAVSDVTGFTKKLTPTDLAEAYAFLTRETENSARVYGLARQEQTDMRPEKVRALVKGKCALYGIAGTKTAEELESFSISLFRYGQAEILISKRTPKGLKTPQGAVFCAQFIESLRRMGYGVTERETVHYLPSTRKSAGYGWDGKIYSLDSAPTI